MVGLPPPSVDRRTGGAPSLVCRGSRADFPARASSHTTLRRTPGPSGAVTPIRGFKMPLIPQPEPVCSQGSGALEQRLRSCHKRGNFARFGAISLHPCLCCGQHGARQEMALG